MRAERLPTKDEPQELFAKLKVDKENAFLLESATGPSRLAEYSFVGFDPAQLIHVNGRRLRLVDSESGSTDTVAVEDPLDEIRRLVPPDSVSGLFRFIGGAVGYISYDSIHYWEGTQHGDGLGQFPEMEFGVFRDGVVFDHLRKEVYYYTLGEYRADEVKRVLRRSAPEGDLRLSRIRPSISRGRFEQMVSTAKEFISAGDIFQVVLSKRHDFEMQGDLGRFYSRLSSINPSPYMYFIKFGERSIIGSSPEMLVRVQDRRIETFPIAGTRPRFRDAKRNEQLSKELLADPKERAEHVMLVDLARNDVGRVSKYGSVITPEFQSIQQYSHVQHMVSRVVGELREGFDSLDALRALFPAGTVSGAPKVRAMEIIRELEPDRRGPYAGAVGYFSFNGNADFAITIRTLVAQGRSCSVQAGAGIVADSVPSREWEETDAKAAGLLSSARQASGGYR
ncbi:MAG: anthranilate synthase component I [Nitrososphaerota archaeon]|nr:anthranilate synthase component I [Nitrososphaerota archaeon]